jgi:hypothetical protein
LIPLLWWGVQELIRPATASVIRLACTAGLVAATCGCSDDGPREAGWTVGRAESVTTIRGMPVRTPRCRGLGAPVGNGKARSYRRFACEAGARRPGESYDSVGVYYEIRPRVSGGYVLENVRFIGLGVP